MKNLNNKGFSLVELLVVITILAILSVVAYQNFGWATDKANSSRKKTDISTIETALQQFKSEKNYYPMPQDYDSSTNVWWYNSWAVASPSNKIKVVYNWQEINSVDTWSTLWWWKVYASGLPLQIWAKWVIWYNGDFNKKYLTKDLYDPELWDVEVKTTSKKLIDLWIWKYVYWVYAQPKTPGTWNISKAAWSYFNIATSLKKADWENYETYIVWDYDANACASPSNCPSTLIWSWTVSLANWNTSTWTSLDDNQWIPYPIRDFSN